MNSIYLSKHCFPDPRLFEKVGDLNTAKVKLYSTLLMIKKYKGFPRNKFFHLVGRASCPPHKLGGQDVHPTINTGIFFYLEVPKTQKFLHLVEL
ncbi:hypothetical protein FDUTEX481_03634 [Tolypothrix sp. PCC 7601]|nr:hypothetical protein FDUTEX481_03634 [Tolypothrix sp. PCC 7601]